MGTDYKSALAWYTFIGTGVTEHIYIGAGVRKQALGINVSGTATGGNIFISPAATNIKIEQNVNINTILLNLLN